ncbi:SDR family oxidoreductase [Verminephrobacter aporrectodeae subsp. tuberculatae]|nr:SDR family oxidoreductase [Verminephrobacter aporrectodeae subsp. tuberculatae]MCW5288205.1 SDR family oxidoreductase [Verminephrobacter aporrectodeae subsp. tuberculatae]MCW8163341.1 SDR family oxidoreductase [Verminephrobacter aporrectodeae subsp. tuberculatae]MCW8167570.1 SDR family oxidoreductase [Verminephrobacter aporrectodeae subsp. tuberculatae]
MRCTFWPSDTKKRRATDRGSDPAWTASHPGFQRWRRSGISRASGNRPPRGNRGYSLRPPPGRLAKNIEETKLTQRLAGKTAFVTAAGQGIGRACALAFAAEGAQVWATDVDEKLLEGYAGVPNVSTRRLDALDDAAISARAKEVGTIQVLLNCTGFVHHGTALDASDEEWDLAFRLNVRAQWKMAQAFLPAMLENHARTGASGSIINIASIASSIRGLPMRFVYGASKAAVIGMTKAIAADFVTRGIRCNALCPGTVDTPSLAERINAFADPVQARKDFIARQPMGRLATAQEIAPLAVFLASDESAFCTGNAYACDGGMTI